MASAESARRHPRAGPPGPRWTPATVRTVSEPPRHGPRYGTVDTDYALRMTATPPEEDGPVWMVNLMKYREIADYGDVARLDGEDAAPHFLGAIVVGQQSSPTGDIAVRHVVDGQQRLITLQLLLDAVEEVIRSYGREKDSFRIRPLILNDPNLFDGDDRFKVWPTKVDREAYRTALLVGP